jgi:TRAP-type C4-dicarboxylate transport system permease small subunit
MAEVSRLRKGAHAVLFYTGSAGLLSMMLVEFLAVLGRHTGLPVMGALEIVQAAIVPAACAAMLIATLHGAHAAVHMLTERMSERAQKAVRRAGCVVAGVFFSFLCVGSVWLAIEAWDTFEQTEVLHIPFRPLRALVALAAAALAILFFHRAVAPGQPK